MTTESNALYKRAVNQISVNLNGDVAILNLSTKTYFGLTDVGVLLWEKLENPSDLSTLCAAVSVAFEVGEAECAPDVTAFLDALDKAQLLAREVPGA